MLFNSITHDESYLSLNVVHLSAQHVSQLPRTMSFHKSPIANLALVTLASLTGAVHASHEEEVSAAFDILNTFDPDNAEPFCAGFINYEKPQTTPWATDAPLTITTTIPCDSSKTGYETGITTTPTPTAYPAYSPVYPVNSTGYASYGTGYASSAPGDSSYSTGYGTGYGTGYASSGPGYASSVPGYGGNSQEVITILTTTTITYTVTSTIYAPAATNYPAYPALAHRDTFCDDFNVPCRLVQYSAPVISEACARYLDQGTIFTAVNDDVNAAAATATVTATVCGYDTGNKQPEPYPAGEEHHDKPAPEKPSDEGNSDGEDAPDSSHYDPTGDGEDAPDSSNYDPTGDGEDAPDSSNYDPTGDGEDAPDSSNYDPTGDGEDVPDAPYDSAGDGEDTPDPLQHEGEGDGTGYSPYD